MQQLPAAGVQNVLQERSERRTAEIKGSQPPNMIVKTTIISPTIPQAARTVTMGSRHRPNLNWNGDGPAVTISRPTLSRANSVKYMFPSLPSVMRWNTVPVLGTW